MKIVIHKDNGVWMIVLLSHCKGKRHKTRRTSTHKPWEHYWEHRVVGMLETVKKALVENKNRTNRVKKEEFLKQIMNS